MFILIAASRRLAFQNPTHDRIEKRFLLLADLGAHWSDTIIWAKDAFTLGRADLQRQYEPIWYGWPDGVKHQWHGGRKQGDVWTIDRPRASHAHPTMKPIELIERALTNSSSAGDLVLDIFLGSGSTLIACERTDRVCRGIELDPHYCDVLLARWESFTGQQADLLTEAIDIYREQGGVRFAMAAHDLALLGFRPTVFETEPVPAGMLAVGIPAYRLPREVIAKEIAVIEALGVEIRCGVMIGRDVSFAELRRDHAAVILSVGAKSSRGLGLPTPHWPSAGHRFRHGSSDAARLSPPQAGERCPGFSDRSRPAHCGARRTRAALELSAHRRGLR